MKERNLSISSFQCAQCAYCRDNEAACPAYRSLKLESVSPRGMLWATKMFLQGRLNFKNVLAAEGLAKAVYNCTFCSACKEVCQVELPLPGFWQALRGDLTDAGFAPKSIYKLFEAISASKNIYSMPQEDRFLWSMDCEEIIEDRTEVQAKVGYFLGCVTSYRSRLAPVATSLVSIMERIGEDFTVFSENELCCGNPFFLGGQFDEGKDLAIHNVEVISKLGIETLVMTCSGCFRAFKEEYPAILGKKLPFRVLHHTQYLGEKAAEGKIKFKARQKTRVTYKDPCEIGRHCGIYKEARDAINAVPGVELRELGTNRDKALCCGAGGLLKVTNPESTKNILENLIKQIEDSKAELVINACPACLEHIEGGLKEKNSEIRCLDLAEFYAQRMDLL